MVNSKKTPANEAGQRADGRTGNLAKMVDALAAARGDEAELEFQQLIQEVRQLQARRAEWATYSNLEARDRELHIIDVRLDEIRHRHDRGDFLGDQERMLAELLSSKPAADAVGSSPAQVSGAPADAFKAPPAAEPVSAVMADDGPPPLTTGDIAFCFDGLRRWDEARWKKALGNKPGWLRDCVAIPGRQGVRETRWNPVLIGGKLVFRGYASATSVRARFQSKPMLKPWLDAWKTYEADYLNSD